MYVHIFQSVEEELHEVETIYRSPPQHATVQCLDCGKVHCINCYKPLPVTEAPPVDDSALFRKVFGCPGSGISAPIPGKSEIDDSIVYTSRRKK